MFRSIGILYTSVNVTAVLVPHNGRRNVGGEFSFCKSFPPDRSLSSQCCFPGMRWEDV
jgi:hypothetical protein